MSETYEQRRQQLELEQMEADIANKRADARLKDEQRRWEPWKAMTTAFAAGVAFATAFLALATWALSHVMR